MKQLKLLLMLFLAFSLLLTCKKNDDEFPKEPDPKEDPQDSTETLAYKTVDVEVKLPDDVNLNTDNVTLVSLGSESDLDQNLSATVPFNPGTIELAYVVDSENELLMAGFLTDERKEISIATTAEATVVLWHVFIL